MKRILFFISLWLLPFVAAGQLVEDVVQPVVSDVNESLVGDVSGYTANCQEYQDIWDAYNTKPTAANAVIDDSLITRLEREGFWSRLDGFWMFANHSDTNDLLINWVDPTGTKAISISEPTFTEYAYVQGDGVEDYINTRWNPSTDAVKYLLDSCAILHGQASQTRNNAMFPLGCTDGTNVLYSAYNQTGSRIYGGLNHASQYIASVYTDTADYHLTTRDEGVNRTRQYAKLMWNSVNIISAVAIPNAELYILCRNNNATPANFSDEKIVFVAVGGEFSVVEFTTFWQHIETRMDAHGNGIIH